MGVGAKVVVYLGQDFLGKSLGNLEKIGLYPGLLQALLLGFGQFLDVAIHGILCVQVSKCLGT